METANITTLQTGTESELPVREGQVVAAGDVFMGLVTERISLHKGQSDDATEHDKAWSDGAIVELQIAPLTDSTKPNDG